jgi:transposase-like protein
MSLQELRKEILASPLNAAGKRKFSKQLRNKIVRFIKSSDLSQANICRELEISAGTVNHWLKNGSASTNSKPRFEQITIVDELQQESKETLTLVSPHGFQLQGSLTAVLEVWRSLHAPASR